MKKYILVLVSICSAYCVPAYSQDDIKKLTIPSSPAFSILGFEPTSVMKPTSNKDLATDVLNSFDKNGKLLMNLGLEVSPYWLQSKPNLTRDQYIKSDPWQTFLQSFSLSAATVKDSASGSHKLGGGFRFKILNGSPVQALAAAEKEVTDVDEVISAIADLRSNGTATIVNAIKFIKEKILGGKFSQKVSEKALAEAIKIKGQFGDSTEGVKLFAEAINKALETDAAILADEVLTISKQRLGLILEFAGASAFNTSENNKLDKMGFWVNASNYVSASDLFTVTARYMWRNGDSIFRNFDAGLSYTKKNDQYNISLEYMLRWNDARIPDLNSAGEKIKRAESHFTYRLAAQASYLISSKISINLSLGKDFDSQYYNTKGFFSILGLNYSIFNNEKVDTKSKSK